MTGLAYSQALAETLTRAERLAQGLGHRAVGPEHLLLALLDAPAGPVALVLESLRLPEATVRAELGDLMPGRQQPVTDHLTLSVSALNALEHAEATARRLHAATVDTDHVLLGIAQGVVSLAARVLLDVGASAEVIRPLVERETAQRLPHLCRQCGHILDQTWRFCPMCATPVASVAS